MLLPFQKLLLANAAWPSSTPFGSAPRRASSVRKPLALGYRVDKQPTWHPIWRAHYLVAVDCRPEVPVPRSTDRLLPGFVETYCGAGLRPGRRSILAARNDTPLPAFE